MKRLAALAILAAFCLFAPGTPTEAAIYRWDNGELITEDDPVPGGRYK